MVRTTHVAWAVGLGAIGLSVLVGPILAQAQGDRAVVKTNSPASRPAAAAPAVVGVVDVEAVIGGYNKMKVQGEEFRAQVMQKQGELVKMMQEGKTTAEMLQKLSPTSPDYKKNEDRITELQASIEAKKAQYQREFSLKEAEMLLTIYREIQDMVARTAKQKGMTYVFRATSKPLSASEPDSVYNAIARPVVYADMSLDITKDVINYLNIQYKNAGGIEPKAAPATGATNAIRPGGPVGPN